jgi:RimJ/RimL family protein N-acetyltransferase
MERDPMTSLIPTLTTERLRLRPFGPDDAATVQRLASDAAVATMTLNIPHPYPNELAETWINGHGEATARGICIWAVTRASDAILMGSITLTANARHQRAETGYWLGLSFWNQGYMTEAVRRVTGFGFEQLGLNRVQATVFPRNPASARVLEKVGFRYEGVLRGYVRRGEDFEDVAMYAVLREDWRA